jgi:hypothetical protein
MEHAKTHELAAKINYYTLVKEFFNHGRSLKLCEGYPASFPFAIVTEDHREDSPSSTRFHAKAILGGRGAISSSRSSPLARIVGRSA